jgi:hypothetical protein
MKKLLILFIAVFAVTIFLEKAFALNGMFGNFSLEHSQRTIRPERFTILRDALMTGSGENFDNEGGPIVASEFISPSNLVAHDAKYKTSDGFDINLKLLSEDMERFGLAFKVTKLDPAYKKSDDNYLQGYNYSLSLSYDF